MGTEIVSLAEQRINMGKFASILTSLVKDSDDETIKAEVKSFLEDVSQAYKIIVVGGEKTGRTTVLRNCFIPNGEQIFPKGETYGIREVRYGVKEAVLQVQEGYNRVFVTDSDLAGMALYDIGSRDIYKTELAHKLAVSADVVVTVFGADNIQDDYVWDFIEKNAIGKKVVCVMTKKDLYSDEIIEQKKKKLLGYMQDLKLVTPVFAVSNEKDAWDDYEAVRRYIRNNILGINPVEQKRQDNFKNMLRVQKDVKVSVEKRCRQFEADKKLLLMMDDKIKSFYDTQEVQIKELKKDVVKVIREEINNYQNSIIKQFDPKEINRNPNTVNKKTFMEWLYHEVNRYERILNNRVDEKTRNVMRQYILEIDEVCTKLQEWLEERGNLLEENDRFFGTIAQSKRTIIKRVALVTEQTHQDYLTIINATEDLFDKVWAARRRYELQTTVTPVVTSAATMTVGVAAATAIGLSISAVGAIVAGLVLATAGYEAGKVLAEKLFDGKLIENTEKYIEEFKQKIAEIRSDLEQQVMEKLDELFENEFQALDKNLLQFRTTINIDSRKIPLLESYLQDMEVLMKQFTREEKEYEYC